MSSEQDSSLTWFSDSVEQVSVAPLGLVTILTEVKVVTHFALHSGSCRNMKIPDIYAFKYSKFGPIKRGEDKMIVVMGALNTDLLWVRHHSHHR